MKKIEIYLDEDCDLCKRGLAKLAKLEKGFYPNDMESENAVCGSRYLNRRTKSGKPMPVGKIELIPDYNASGIMTHMHIR
jgi:hypothetical protein